MPGPPPGDLTNPGIEPASLVSPSLVDRFFTTSTTWEALQDPEHPSIDQATHLVSPALCWSQKELPNVPVYSPRELRGPGLAEAEAPFLPGGSPQAGGRCRGSTQNRHWKEPGDSTWREEGQPPLPAPKWSLHPGPPQALGPRKAAQLIGTIKEMLGKEREAGS